MPLFVKQELEQINATLSPETIRIGTLLSQQASYNNRSVHMQGTVLSVVSLDEMDEQTVSTWFLNLPTTVETTASVTYFYLQDEMGQKILVKYPADLEVSAQDTVTIVGKFRAHGVTVETKGLLRTRPEEIVNVLGEPFVGAIIVENQTKQKMEYIRQSR